jgi:biotin carboxyl carrier protein
MTLWLNLNGKKQRIDLPPNLTTGKIDCIIEGRPLTADVQLLQPGVMSLLIAGRQYRCILDGDAVLIAGQRFPFEVDDPRSLQGRRGAGAGTEGPRPVKAPMPGRVVRVLVAAGEDVTEGQGVIVIEAMKMQNELKSPKAGRVVRIAVAVDDTVASGDVLAVVE